MPGHQHPQRSIPSIDHLLRSDQGRLLAERAGHDLALEAYRHASSLLRAQLAKAGEADAAAVETALNGHAQQWLDQLLAPSLKPVFNLTGTVLHTNLGRAPLPEECIEAIVAVSRGASNLEYQLDKGRRGERDAHVERWLCRMTGAEAATVVNNNAAAVLLVLNSLAARRAVAVSRGELVEIGGSFRIPDIMQRASCELLEVGTTNRTHPADYSQAVDAGAVALMRVHTSNYKIEGFTAAVADADLAALAADRGVHFINDLGSGALIDMSRFGLPAETTAAEAVAAGADVVTFSGDKLLGGPQCGLIVGRKSAIDLIRKNPMKRALRCDKMTLAALQALLRLYADPERLCARVPSLRLLARSNDEIRAVSERCLPALARALAGTAVVSCADCASQIGSGAVPLDTLPSTALLAKPLNSSGRVLEKLAQQLRSLPIPMIGRISDGCLWFDMRCVENPAAFADNISKLSLH